MLRPRYIAAVYAGLIFYTVVPLLSVALSSWIASATHSKLNEADVHPCIVLGHDFGEVVYGMFVFGWAGLLTIPTGILALIAFTVFVVARWIRHRRSERRQANQSLDTNALHRQ